MGFFSKAWKGIKSAVKGIGKQIKKATKSVGKFMDKVGVVGQIALAFVLPGIGSALGGMLSGAVGAMAGSSSAIVSGIGKVLQTAGKFASTVGNAYKTVTGGITDFVSKIGKGFVNQTGSLLGKKGLVFSNGPASVGEGFKSWMKGVAHDVQNIPSPYRVASNEVASSVVEIPFENTFDPNFETPSIGDNFSFQTELGKPQFDKVIQAETQETTGFLSRTSEYARGLAKRAAETVVDTAAQNTGSLVAQGAAQAVGIQTQPTYETTTVNNVVPQFNSTPVNTAYESSGLGYGALPQHRLQFYAAQQMGGDFGLGAFNNFSGLRTN